MRPSLEDETYTLGEQLPDVVVLWRAEQLERAGYTEQQAAGLACLRHVDLRDACRLVQRGCPPATAVRILA